MFYPPPEIKKALLRFSQLYIKTLLGFCCSVSQSCLTPCDPMNFSMPGFPVHHHFQKLAQTRSVGLLMPSNHRVLCHAFCLLLLPSVVPSIRCFFFCFFFFFLPSELTLPIRMPKYWTFSISSSTEYYGLISLRIDWLDLLAVQGTLKSLLQHHSSKRSILQHSNIFMVQIFRLYLITWNTIALTLWTCVDKINASVF